MMIFKKFIFSMIFLCICVAVYADESQTRMDEDARQAVDQVPSHKAALTWMNVDYGGWINARYNHFSSEDNNESASDSLRNYNYIDGRVWMKWVLTPEALNGHEHAFYVRVKDRYITRSGDAPGARYDIDGPHLDYAYTILDFRPVWVEVGRRYFNVGRGLVYSDINNGIQINFRKPGFNVGLFVAKTLPRESNIDTSVPGYDKDSERYFYGLGVGYTGIPHQSIYGFFLTQQDLSNEDPVSSQQNYTYDSQYVGVGAKGSIAKSWLYWTELVNETGSSRVFGTDERKDVRAYAFDMEVVFAPDKPKRPRLSWEYAFGSGDSDRINVTNTQSGNIVGHDTNFLYFGYAPTGYALAPRLSNLHMLKAGFTVSPFERRRQFRDLTLGLEYYQFLKHRKEGGISDLEATESSRDIGREVDLSVKWRILSDVTMSFEYGHFMPGNSYADAADNPQDFISAGVIHTF